MRSVITVLRNYTVAYGVPAMAALTLHGAVAAGVWSAHGANSQPPEILQSFQMTELPSSAAVIERVVYEVDPEPTPAPEPEAVDPPPPEPDPLPAPLPQPKPKPKLISKTPPPEPKVQAKVPTKPIVAPQPKSAVLSDVVAQAPASAYVAPSQHAAYLDNPKPAYPTVARQRGMEGRVVLRVAVRRDGSVRTVEVEQSTGFAMLDRAARNAVVHWRFAPATRGGVAVEGEVLVPFDFRLSAG